jgi:hypothetical protein
MLYQWVYVSQATFAKEQAYDIVSEIVDFSRPRNASLGVTGALVFNGTRFSQLLEGGEAEVLELQRSIRRDLRHDQITTVQMGTGEKRLFGSWSLVYSGPSRFLGRILDNIELNRNLQARSPRRELLELFSEFSRDPSGH